MAPPPMVTAAHRLCLWTMQIKTRCLKVASTGASWLARLGLGLALSTGVSGQTILYKWVDAQGVIHYSDRPSPGAKRIEINTADSTHTSAAGMHSLDAAPQDRQPIAPVAGYQSCLISDPKAEQSLFAPDTVHVGVALEPGLRPGDQLAVSVDGQPLSGAAGSADFNAPGLDRGSHTVTAVVKDQSGRPVCTAPPITFYIQRPSVLAPGRGH